MREQYFDITDKHQISDFKNYISTVETPVLHCPVSGSITFFMDPDITVGNKNSVAMDFCLDTGCEYIRYPYAGITQTKQITPEGLTYLRAKRDAVFRPAATQK